MDLKEPGNVLMLLGQTRDELGGSHYHLVTGNQGGLVPQLDVELAPRIFEKLHQAMQKGLVRSCHDLSEGGLAVAVAEMAFAGGVGADLNLADLALPDVSALFSESPSRFLLEVRRTAVAALKELFENLPLAQIGQTVKESRLRIAGTQGDWIVWTELAQLKSAWQNLLAL
jgi:phosphoribosylformylglycinamidine (FGAM) synthase-like enzyme